ncbi:type II toxin-antitoxin system TacA family antitoxin [Nocardia brasiliensis]
MSPKTERFEIRLAEDGREQIEAAAGAVGETLTEFVRNAAIQRADQVLALSSRTMMSAEQFDAMIRSLDIADDAPELAKAVSRGRRFVRR